MHVGKDLNEDNERIHRRRRKGKDACSSAPSRGKIDVSCVQMFAERYITREEY
jgi:hypothetical protein